MVSFTGDGLSYYQESNGIRNSINTVSESVNVLLIETWN